MPDSFLERNGCTGFLTWNENRLPVSFQVKVDLRGEISFVFDPISVSKDTLFLSEIWSRSRATFEVFQLAATHPDGTRLQSQSTFLTSYHSSSSPNGSFLGLKATSYDLDLQIPPGEKDESPIGRVEYLVAGMKSIRMPSIDTQLGKLSIYGEINPRDSTSLNGAIAIDTELCDANGLELIDNTVERLLEILSLANGRIIQWSVRKLFIGRKGANIRFRGSMASTEPQFPLFSHLHLGPAANAALRNYTQELRERTGLNVAIAWSLMHPQYTEGDFLAAMTALEHLIHVYNQSNHRCALVRKEDFRKVIRPALEGALSHVLASGEVACSDDVRKELIGKLGGLNKPSLRSNIQAFMSYYGVPVNDLQAKIPELIDLRNDIVHRGLASGPGLDYLEYLLAVLRELLARVFLTLIGYRGSYWSYLNGPETKVFPPDMAT